LAGGAAGWVVGFARSVPAQSTKKSPLTSGEDRVVAGIRDKAKTAQLGAFAVRWTEHFVGVGDAPPDAYIAAALGICETFSTDFLVHFRDLGFKLEVPDRRMTVVALKDADSYGAYSGAQENMAVGGHYDITTNELVVFDFRQNQAGLAAAATRINTFTLVHETAHMLCYNTGLLPAGRDIPVAISEGLATYAELWARRERKAIGRANLPRLGAIGKAEVPWIPVGRLLGDDGAFDDPKSVDLAYAESWLLVHHLLKQPNSLPRFRSYLAGFPKPGGKMSRAAYAESVLGSLPQLDTVLRQDARRIQARGR
jgi:hypothetical protein